MRPKTVVGIPLYNEAAHLPAALESLLGQSRRELAVVVVDEGSTDGSQELVREYASVDPRVTLRVNSARVGLTANWRRAYELARELHPDAAYFAWGSGHDVWHPCWLAGLAAELERHPEAVLAYPLSVAVTDTGGVERLPWRWDTAGLGRARERLARGVWAMRAGDMVYGLFRASAPGRAGGFRSVLWPDRLLLAELAAEGSFRQVPELLWFRRHAIPGIPSRQRASNYPDGAPWWSHLPWPVQHAGALALAGKRSLAAEYLVLSGAAESLRVVLRARNRAAGGLVARSRPLRAVLAGVETRVAEGGGRVKLLPEPPAPFDALPMVNRHPARPALPMANRHAGRPASPG